MNNYSYATCYIVKYRFYITLFCYSINTVTVFVYMYF